MGGGAAGDQGIAPRVQAQFEYGHGFHLPAQGFLRGVEAGYQQRWLWYRGARALSLAPTSVLYLPKDWTWLFRLSMTQLSLSSQKSWKPAGLTRLTFPIHRALTGHLLFANGMENFGTVDQVLWSATRTVGGGLRVRLVNRQELLTFVEYQRLAAGRSQTGLGIVYALRF